MALIPSEIQGVPPKDESTGSETSIRSSLYDYTLTRDLVLRSMIEEYDFQALSEDLVIKRPCYKYSVPETDELHTYYNRNFKRGHPQLLLRMQRRVGINNVSPISSLVQDNKKHVKASVNKDDCNSEFLPETSGESALSTSTCLTVPFIQKLHTSQLVTNTNALFHVTYLTGSSPISVRQTDQIVVDQPAVLKILSIFNWHSHSSHTQVNGHVENFATTATSTSQNHFVSPLHSIYSGLMVKPSKFPVRHSNMSGHDSHFPNLQERGNSWFSVPTIAYTSASSLSTKLINNHNYMKTMLIKTDLSNTC
ncbi:hypothetical protein E5288_WYG013486 [Bos mutus]|uniref:Uncharacterized protein n=1 Tax=Bos mutus TaxID=72004 RepID=A0A6B0SL26_9CETA|nr:hypothetical protein [Bos mutus]